MKGKKRRAGKPQGLNYADVLRRMAEDVSRMDIRYYGKLRID